MIRGAARVKEHASGGQRHNMHVTTLIRDPGARVRILYYIRTRTLDLESKYRRYVMSLVMYKCIGLNSADHVDLHTCARQ